MERLGDVAKTENGEPLSATCTRCEQPFEYMGWPIPLRNGGTKTILRDVCDACLEEEQQQRDLEERRRRYERESPCRLSQSERGSRLAAATFATFQETPQNAKALGLAARWMAEIRRPNLIIMGPVQSGKSYLAACVFNALHEQLEPAFWLNAGSFMALVRRGFTDKEAAAEAGRKSAAAERAPYLVLDDLGKVHPGKDISWVEETFYAIVEARYRDELPTIVTTEWTGAGLVERVGLSVKSRLQHGALVAGMKKAAVEYRRQSE